MFEIIECEHVDADGTRCPVNNTARSIYNNGNGNFCAEHFAADNAARAAAAATETQQ